MSADSAFTSASKDIVVEERQFHPVSASLLIDQDLEEDIEWVFEGYLPVGGLVILAAKPKVGKTTLAYQLAVKVAKGEAFLERPTMKGSVLILALEEHPRDVKLRLKELGGNMETIHVHTGGLEPNPANMLAIEKFVSEHSVKLVLVDTIAMFWQLEDESNASALIKAVKPLLRLARRTGACVLLIHHFRKSQGADGDDIRGSGALFAAVDVAIRVYQNGTTERSLVAVGRYADTPRELTVELKDGEYSLVDAERRTAEGERERLIGSLTSEPQTIEVVAKTAGVALTRAYRHMKVIRGTGQTQVHGQGVKGDPYLYSLIPADALSSNSLPLQGEVKVNGSGSGLAG
jgi:KaiC/GvpD/RAD55 family RecA-like ATPase